MELLVFFFSLLLPTQLGKHFFFPFSYLSGIRIDYLAPTLYITDIISFTLILLSFSSSWKIIKQQLKNPIFSLSIYVLIAINFIFALSKPLWLYGFARLLQFIFLFLCFHKQGRKKYIYSALIWGFFLGSCAELTLSLLQLSARHSIQGWWYYLGERSFSVFTPGIAKAYFMGKEFLRPYGTFSHPNSLGGFYLLIYAFILTQKKITHLLLKGALLFTSTALIIISFSRTTLVVYIFVNLLYFSKSISCRICFLAKICISIVFIVFIFNISGDVYSFQKRTDFFEKSLVIIVQKPFTGTGIGSYLIAQHQYPQKFSTFFEQPVHNIFLFAIAQLGIPLSLIFSTLIIRIIRVKNQSFHLLLPIAAAILTGCADHYWFSLQQNVLVLAVISGILFEYEKTPS